MKKDPKQCECRSVTPQGRDWSCDICGKRFFPLNFEQGNIQIMEPYATLRDQFAMAALGGLIISTKDYTGITRDDVVGEAYRHADSMLEAIKQ